jgi:hypothetical protein
MILPRHGIFIRNEYLNLLLLLTKAASVQPALSGADLCLRKPLPPLKEAAEVY